MLAKLAQTGLLLILVIATLAGLAVAWLFAVHLLPAEWGLPLTAFVALVILSATLRVLSIRRE